MVFNTRNTHLSVLNKVFFFLQNSDWNQIDHCMFDARAWCITFFLMRHISSSECSHHNIRWRYQNVPMYFIYIYKEESLFVCLFFMHSVPVRARAAKLCMAHPWVKGKVKTGSTGPRGGEGGTPPVFKKGWKIFGFLKNVENVLRFLRYLHLAFISSHCP
jgi:hypothetical protein